jgi:hypothetical protein
MAGRRKRLMSKAPRLDDLLKPGKPLPPDDIMIAKALDVLDHSPHGQQLANFAREQGITIKIMATPQPTAYLPESKLAYIGFSRSNPISPSRFILMLTGLLREAQQEHAGLKHPMASSPLDEHIKTGMAKQEDKLWYMCTVACELNDQQTFNELYLLDELRKMGHNEILSLYLKQERPEGGNKNG